MNYENVESLEKDFITGNFDFPDQVSLQEIPFDWFKTSSYSMGDMMKKNYKAMVIYSANDARSGEARKAAGLKKWVIFLWGFTKKGRLVPYAVRNMTPARASAGVMTEAEVDANDIGNVVEIKITNLPRSNVMQGKVDTGADISSLHADAFKINRSNNTVTFRCPELSPNDLTMQLVDQQAVKTADNGVEYRPVVELNIKINGKLLNGVNFNLNDRGSMTYPILLGKNALVQGKFKIDPSLGESAETPSEEEVDWNLLQEEFNQIEAPTTDAEMIEQIYNTLSESDISFADLVRFIRTDVTNNVMENLED